MSNPPRTTSILKRPRSTSQPPSPTSSSSPKRAASEDNYGGTSENGGDSPVANSSSTLTPGGTLGSLGTGMNLQGVGSSPLRHGGEDEAWVKQTEDVHSSSETGGETDMADSGMDLDTANDGGLDQAKLREQYHTLLSAVSPPFDDWSLVYIIPSTILSELKASAFGDSQDTTASLPKIDLTSLIKDADGEEVIVIGATRTSEGKGKSDANGSKTLVWSVKDGSVENDDFMFISEEGWKNIVEWYGPYDGPVLPRFCQPGEKIQMVPPIFTVHLIQRPSAGPQSPSDSPLNTTIKPLKVSCPTAASLSELTDFLRDSIKDHVSAQDHVRLWTIDVSSSQDDTATSPALSSLTSSPKLLVSLAGSLLHPESSASSSLGELGSDHGDSLAIETKKADVLASWTVDVNPAGKAVEKASLGMTVPTAPPPSFSKPAYFSGTGLEVASTSTSTPASSVSGIQTRSQGHKARRGKGSVGLNNSGNTCFMNSAVQCLSNTPESSEYFLTGVYEEESNPDNPSGMHGEIANAFGETIQSLWGPSSPHASFAPRRLKWKTGHFAPQFAGYGQHDTQEFIAFLLDGSHEDLNRIKKKPYIEKPDWKPGGGDRELAELGRECWEGYKKRNDSVIVDLFQGQSKSTLVCPECHKESITSDPFMYLTVPSPIAQTKVFKCLYVPLDPESPQIKIKLLIPQNASFMQVKEKIASLVGTKADHSLGLDMWKGYIYGWWLDSDHNGEAKESDVAIFYELAVPVSATRKAVGTLPSESTITVPVFTFRTVEPSRNSYRQEPDDCISQPFFITLTKTEATDPVAVREAITKGYKRWTKDELKDALWVHSSSRRAARASPVADEEEPVTEIHVDGDNTRVVEVPARPIDGMDLDTTPAGSSILNSPKFQRVASSASLSDAASIKSSKSGKLVPRGDSFKVHVADASSAKDHSSFNISRPKPDAITPMYIGTPRSASNSWSRLESRKKAKRGMLGSIASGFKNMVGSSNQSEDESSPPATPVGPPLVVRPGEGIFCEWPHQKFNEFFEAADPTLQVSDELVDPDIAKEIAKKKEGRSISLEDCLDEFSKEETLGQDDLWYCPQCKKHQAATKKLEIYQAPDILVICLKRFGSSRRSNDKSDHFVSFPMEGLDLSDRIDERKIAQSLHLSEEEAAKYGFQSADEPLIYDLYAVDNHFGGMGGGHYTAFCRNKIDGQWYNYDDSRVSKANPEAVQSRAAYLLFYRRRTSRPIGGISRIKIEEASRAASPVPSSPEAEPAAISGLSSQSMTRRSSGSTSSTDPMPSADGPSNAVWAADPLDGDMLDVDPPAYDASGPGTPPAPSPTSSSASDSPPPTLDFSSIGNSIGFGNSAWGSGATSETTAQAAVHHSFGAETAARSTNEGGQSLPSPPASDNEA